MYIFHPKTTKQLSFSPAYADYVQRQGGGPKTSRSKVAFSRNSITHGLPAAAPLLGEAIRRIHTGQSVGALFNRC